MCAQLVVVGSFGETGQSRSMGEGDVRYSDVPLKSFYGSVVCRIAARFGSKDSFERGTGNVQLLR